MADTELIIKIIFSLLVGVAMAAALVIGVNELVWYHRRKQLRGRNLREMLLSISQIPPYVASSILIMPVWLVIYETASNMAFYKIETTPVIVLLALLMADFSYYWEHRCAHKISLLWKLYHAIHHGSSAYTIATAYRVSFLNLLMAPAFYLPWILLGIDPLLILGFQMFAFHYQAWLHTELIGRLGLLDRIINTPANHRMHHSRSMAHKDVNFGALLMLWDYLFGTYHKPEEQLEYGIQGVEPPKTFLSLYTLPFKSRRHDD
jgi:sterol desaturase/sphingolipid hydroxylase (fatty acid hydroxylase superfamily)